MSEPFRSELFKIDVPDVARCARLEISDIRVRCEMTLTEKCGCSQYIAVPMKEQPLSRVSHQVSPRGSPSMPPSRRSSRRKMPTSAQVNQLPPPPPSAPTPPRDDEPCYSEIKKDRERPRKTAAEEKNSIIYAALNHQPLEGTAVVRPRRPIEENSEYAAIRVS